MISDCSFCSRVIHVKYLYKDVLFESILYICECVYFQLERAIN